MVSHYLYIVFSVWLFIGLSHNLAGLQIQQPQRHVTSADAFKQFENKVSALSDYNLTFSVSTEGAISSKIEGTISVQSGKLIDLSAEGMYDGQPVKLQFRSDGVKLTGSRRTQSFEEPAPEGFLKYFAHGIMRLGVAKYLFRLVEMLPPLYPIDEDDQEAWAAITYISTGERRFVGNVEAFPFGMRYSSFGEELGEARLWINVASGLPFRREGTLRIDAGVVNVVEFYGFSR